MTIYLRVPDDARAYAAVAFVQAFPLDLRLGGLWPTVLHYANPPTIRYIVANSDNYIRVEFQETEIGKFAQDLRFTVVEE
jgi:hypothetical protein